MAQTREIFEPASFASWIAMVEKLLGGKPLSHLDRVDDDGLVTQAFYAVQHPDVNDLHASRILPPAAPSDRLARGWEICQPIDRDAENAEILEALVSGATALIIDDPDVTKLDTQLSGVMMPAITLGFDRPPDPVALYRWLMDRGAERIAAQVDFGIDPFRDAGDIGLLANGLSLLGDGQLTGQVFRVDGWVQHNAGLTTAQELGFVIAGLAEILRHGFKENFDLGQLGYSCSVRMALPPDMFAGITKCRAMRILWSGLLTACDIDQKNLPPSLKIAGYASHRMLSVLDAEVNMLRITTALLGGAIGGADMMAASGHDILTGESPAASRLVRMTQVIMHDEAALASSIDPAAGSPFIESRSDALAEAGWKVFQNIEEAGGLFRMLSDGGIDRLAASAAAERDIKVRAGALDLVGVTLQPRQEQVVSALPQFATVRRPAAVIEQLRIKTASHAPRLILLCGDGADAIRQEKDVRRWLTVAGLPAVTLVDAASLQDAKPDWVIGCGIDDATKVGVARFMPAGMILHAEDRVAVLESLLLPEKDVGYDVS